MDLEKREELVTRLRAELRINKKAYAQLQKEKEDLSKVCFCFLCNLPARG